MSRLLAEREPFYLRADLIVEPDPEDPERSAAVIAGLLGRLSPPDRHLISTIFFISRNEDPSRERDSRT